MVEDTDINKEIANYFICDSREFLLRYSNLRQFQTQISNRSKLMIDLLFSLECSLKAIIFIESLSNEKATYKQIRTHNLKQLYGLIMDKSGLGELNQSIIQNSNIYNVISRYTLEANISFRVNGVLGDLYYDTIANFSWLENLHKLAKDVLRIAESKLNFKLHILNFNDINIVDELEKASRVENISKP